MAVTITKQPSNVTALEGKITQSLTLTASGATGYQWKQAVNSSEVEGASNVEGATTNTMTIPTELEAGEYYYFCEVTDGESPVNSNIVVVRVVTIPDVITGNAAWNFVEGCDPSIKKRLESLISRTGIPIPKSDVALRSAQISLLMQAI